MAWSDPGDFTSGQILTAAQMDSIREAMFFGQGTFTNEAARDTAYNAAGAMSPITLQEGMRTYLTASTIAAATGTSTTVPSGITTVYNGSNWPCITPVGATSTTNGTTNSTSYVTTLTGDATAISCTLVTGTTALVTLSNSFILPAVGVNVFMTYSVSGATTVAASDANGFLITTPGSNYYIGGSRTLIVSGLTAGTNTFTLNYKVAANTVTFINRNLVVQGVA